MKEHFNNLGFEISGILHLTGKQAIQCLQSGAFLLDVREDYEIALKEFGCTNILFCPFEDFDQQYQSLPKDVPLIVADCVGLNSKVAVGKLINLGFEMVANLAGGVADWEKDGLPMKKDVESMNGPCPCMIRSRG